MPAKTPIYLKPANGKSGNLKNSKKIRELLSTDMISPPLGDFRHMAHIGRGGDEDRFGDISFMKKEPETKEGTFKRAASWGKKKRTASAIETQTLDRKPRKRMEVRSTDNINSQIGLESPILKNAVSLPSLNKEGSTSSTPPSSPNGAPAHNNNIINGKVEERLNASKANEQYSSTPGSNNPALDGPPKPRRIMADEQPPSNFDQSKFSPLRRSSEVLTEKPNEEDYDNWSMDLELDLGPSLLDEVLGIMDRVEV